MQQKKLYWIDKLRCLSILLVILVHSIEEGIYSLDLKSVIAMPLHYRLFPFICFTVGRIGVPIFLLITGYLFLDRFFNEGDSKKFWKSNWMHLILCTQFWFLLYDIFLIYCQRVSLTFYDILQDIFFLNKVQMSHVWYMPVIIGLYAFIPFVANAIHVLKTWKNHNLFLIPIFFFIIVLFFYPTISVIIKNTEPNSRVLTNQINAGYSGGIYGLYLIFGWLIKDGLLRQIKSIWLIVIFVVSCIVAVWIQIWSYQNGIGYNIWYDSPMLLVSSMSIFELFSRTKNNENKFTTFLSGNAFGIYLIHFPIKLILLDYVLDLQYKKEFQVFILFFCTFILSLWITHFFSKIPKIGNYLLYKK